MGTKGVGSFFAIVLTAASLGAADADLRLIEAAKRSDLASVRTLLKQGLDVNVRAGDGATALHWAAYRDRAELVQLLIQSKAQVNATNELGVTPLWVAATSRGVATVEALLAAGAKPNLVPPTGETPLMIAARTGNVEAIKLLIAHGADVNAKEAARGQTALMWAISDRQPEAARLLIEAGADLRARTASSRHFVQLCCSEYNGDTRGTAWVDYGGFTPLLFAAREGELESAKYLLAAGADVNDAGADGASALAVAAFSGQSAVAQLLIEHGADLNASGGGYAALHAAVERGDLSLAKSLIAAGADLNVRLTKPTQARRTHDDYAFDKKMIGATPFMLAAKDGEAEFMRLFAGAGADRSIGRLDDGAPPLVVAALGEQHARNAVTLMITPGQRMNREAERRALEAMKVVIELGADVNGTDNWGNTALHVAARKRFESVIRFLVEKGARLEAKNQLGETPLALALRPLPPPPGAVIATFGMAVNDEGPQIAEVLRGLGARE
jgi:ankyrin repeat protein